MKAKERSFQPQPRFFAKYPVNPSVHGVQRKPVMNRVGIGTSDIRDPPITPPIAPSQMVASITGTQPRSIFDPGIAKPNGIPGTTVFMAHDAAPRTIARASFLVPILPFKDAMSLRNISGITMNLDVRLLLGER